MSILAVKIQRKCLTVDPDTGSHCESLKRLFFTFELILESIMPFKLIPSHRIMHHSPIRCAILMISQQRI